MVFAVVGVLNNMTKTVLLFMIPQMFNFIYSCPQLFRFVECPRHRMPKLNLKTGLVEHTRFSLKGAKFAGRSMILFLEVLNLVDVKRENGCMIDCNNLTLLNLILLKMGPMKELNLAKTLVVVQVICSIVGFFIRYGAIHAIYN